MLTTEIGKLFWRLFLILYNQDSVLSTGENLLGKKVFINIITACALPKRSPLLETLSGSPPISQRLRWTFSS